MHNSMIPNGLPTIVIDSGGDFIPCSGTGLEELIQSAASVRNILVGSETGTTTTAMRKLAGTLEAVRHCAEGEFSHVCCDVSDAYDNVRRHSWMRVLTGLSPDESTLIVAFASPWVGECLVEAKTPAPQPPSSN